MTSNKIPFLILLGSLTLVIIVGCENPLGPALDELRKTNTYLPLDVGRKWVYSYNGESEATIEVVEKETFMGKNVSKFRYIINGSTYTMRYFNETTGLYFYSINWTKELEYPLIVGQQWNSSDSLTRLDYLVIAREDVGTEYGNIKDCIKIEISRYRKNFKDFILEGLTEKWYKKNLGIVKLHKTYYYSPEDNYTISLKSVHSK